MIFGWDISTSVVGLTILDEKGKWIKSSYFDFPKEKVIKKDPTIYDKMSAAEDWILEQLKPFKSGVIDHVFEESLANFSFGRTSMQTLMMLGAFNAMFSYRVMQIHLNDVICQPNQNDMSHVTMHRLHPSTVKADMKKEGLVIPKGADKKQMTLDFVMKQEPKFPIEMTRTGKPKPYCYDMADSFITARAGYVREYLSLNAP